MRKQGKDVTGEYPSLIFNGRDQKPGAPDTSLRTRSAPLGMRVIRMRASLIWAPVAFSHSYRIASERDRSPDRHGKALSGFTKLVELTQCRNGSRPRPP